MNVRINEVLDRFGLFRVSIYGGKQKKHHPNAHPPIGTCPNAGRLKYATA
jgi:hypothetical protein